MHPNRAFRRQTERTNLTFARARGFGVLAVHAEAAPLISHVPFVIDAAGEAAELHLVRSNPIVQRVQEETPAVIVVSGPDGYVSPDWYGDPTNVPTWNYVAVHLRGELSPVPDELLREHLVRVSAAFERRLPKTPWTLDKMPGPTLDRMMRAIRPFRFVVHTVDGTWKLNQNKPDDARKSAARHIGASTVGQELEALSRLMTEGAPSLLDGEDPHTV